MSLTLRSDKPNSPQFQIPKEGADLAIACESGSEALPCQLKMNP
jgi:hypothetical protein